MPKIKLKNIDNVAKALNRSLRIELNKLFRDTALRLKVGEIVEADIKKNFIGKSAEDSTKKVRDYLIKNGNIPDNAYSRDRAKAIFTGKLLDDLSKSVKGFPTQSTFEISHSNKKHHGYKTAKGRTKKISYTELSDILVNNLKINYFVLSDKAQKDIAELIIDKFSTLIRELNR